MVRGGARIRLDTSCTMLQQDKEFKDSCEYAQRQALKSIKQIHFGIQTKGCDKCISWNKCSKSFSKEKKLMFIGNNMASLLNSLWRCWNTRHSGWSGILCDVCIFLLQCINIIINVMFSCANYSVSLEVNERRHLPSFFSAHKRKESCSSVCKPASNMLG